MNVIYCCCLHALDALPHCVSWGLATTSACDALCQQEALLLANGCRIAACSAHGQSHWPAALQGRSQAVGPSKGGASSKHGTIKQGGELTGGKIFELALLFGIERGAPNSTADQNSERGRRALRGKAGGRFIIIIIFF